MGEYFGEQAPQKIPYGLTVTLFLWVLIKPIPQLLAKDQLKAAIPNVVLRGAKHETALYPVY